MKSMNSVRLNGFGFLLLAITVLIVGCTPSESKKTATQGAAAGQTSANEPAKEPADKLDAKVTSEASAQPAGKSKDKPAGEPVSKSTAEAQVPLGLPPVPAPADNPMTPEKIALGKMLYFDKRLSRDGTVSCATCHDPNTAWTEYRATSEGIGKQLGGRNSPTVINAAYATTQFWDGRAASLEVQALGPIENPIEMGHSLDTMIQDLSKLDGYKEQFKKAFGTEITKDGVAKAIASFERTILSGNSPYDRYKAGDQTALNEAQKRGMTLFEDNCATCHTPPTFSNYRFINAGVGMDKEKPDEGRKDVTHKDSDLGRFRVPALRDAAKTNPYFHDGSIAKLEDAVDLMVDGGLDNPHLSSQMKVVREANLTADNQKDIVEFLKALSGEYPVIEPPALP